MRLTVAVTAGLLLCGCSTAVAGQGTYLGSTATQTTAPPIGAPPTTTAAPTPTPTPVRYDPGRRVLACRAAPVLAPKGGPYCYPIPAGMRDVTGEVKLDAGTGAAQYVTAVGLAGRDVIVVLAYHTPLNTDLLPNATIAGDLRRLLASLTTAGYVFASRTSKVTKVDRARAFSYHARSQDSSYQSDMTFIFRGRSQVEVLCQYADRPAAVRRACRQVLSTLQIRTVT